MARGRQVLLAFIVLTVLGTPSLAWAQTTWCPGSAEEPARRLEVMTSAAGAAPYVTLSPVGGEGAWLIDYGATASSANRLDHLPASDPRWVDASRTDLRLSGFDFPFSPPQQVVANLPRAISEDGVGLQQGVIGTDLLSHRTVEIHYERPEDQHLLVTNTSCLMAGRGFFLIRQAGYFGSKPEHFVTQGVNVPVVFIGFERADGIVSAARTPAQLDTGMADTVWPRTIYVNAALWRTIKTDGAVRQGQLSVKQCDGSANLEVWSLPASQLQVTDESGLWMTKYPAFYVVPLAQLPGTSACGGIATMSAPAAQLGASFLRTFGTVVVDPAAYPDGGAVWIRMPQVPEP